MKHLSNVGNNVKKVDKPKKKKRPEATQPKKKKSSVTKNTAVKAATNSNGGAPSEKLNRPSKEVRRSYFFFKFLVWDFIFLYFIYYSLKE